MNVENTGTIVPLVEPSTGEIFKKQYGYSRTMSKMMRKHNCKTPEEYRVFRKKARKERRSK